LFFEVTGKKSAIEVTAVGIVQGEVTTLLPLASPLVPTVAIMAFEEKISIS